MDISFISVNFKSAASLERLLSSLAGHFRGADLEIEFIVVNNDAHERTQIESLKKHFSELKVIHAPGNIGFGQANQLGNEGATGEILFFINPDTIFQAGNFHGLIKALEFRQRAILGMALERIDGKRERWSSGPFPSLWQLIRNNCWVLPKNVPWEAKKIQPTDWVSGAALAVRREFFRELSGFDPEFFLYFEDVDLARRAKEYGATVAVYPFIHFLHQGGGSTASTRSQKRFFYASQRHYFKKWRPQHERVLINVLHGLFHCR